MLSKRELSQKFLNFGINECKDSCKLYEHLALEIAKDDELLEICMHVRNGQPVPNLFFGTIQYILFKGKEHKLKEYYPSLVENPKLFSESFLDFKDICIENKNEILHLLKTKRVQTNEVRRCAYLYPVFGLIFEKTKKPLALFEIGTSAGLQLLWDKYAYSYVPNEKIGNKTSELIIYSEAIGENTPIFPKNPPPVSTRIGFDLHIIELENEVEKLWLKALIWPEHKERMTMFEKASSYLNQFPIQLVEGDGVDLLDKFVAKEPMDHTICIFHTHVANQMPIQSKQQLLNIVQSIGKKRNVFHIYNNMQDNNLHLDYYLNGVEFKQTVAETDGHGRWFKWL